MCKFFLLVVNATVTAKAELKNNSILCDCVTSAFVFLPYSILYSLLTVLYMNRPLYVHPCKHDAQHNSKLDHCALIVEALMNLGEEQEAVM